MSGNAEPSAERGWLFSRSKEVLDQLRDPKFASRLLLAFALSIAVHEILAGLVPGRERPQQQERVIAQVVTLSKRTPPPPTPRPTPVPTPRVTPPPPTPAPHYTLAPKVVVKAPAPRAAATPHHLLGGAAAPRHLALVTPHPVPSSPPHPVRSLARGTALGQQNGGAGTGAGAGRGDSGAGGTGTGNASNGNGNGGDTNTAPCGAVTFLGRVDHFDPDGTVHVHVRIEVRLRDGSLLEDELHWLWTYKSQQDNPFDPSRPDAPVTMQLPPSGYDLSQQKAATIFALQHTSPAGYTDLPECPPLNAPQ